MYYTFSSHNCAFGISFSPTARYKKFNCVPFTFNSMWKPILETNLTYLLSSSDEVSLAEILTLFLFSQMLPDHLCFQYFLILLLVLFLVCLPPSQFSIKLTTLPPTQEQILTI